MVNGIKAFLGKKRSELIRFDIQLHFRYLEENRIRRDFDTPESYRRKSSEDPDYASIGNSWWRGLDFYIEVAPDKEEYICPT